MLDFKLTGDQLSLQDTEQDVQASATRHTVDLKGTNLASPLTEPDTPTELPFRFTSFIPASNLSDVFVGDFKFVR